jgi:hypothetical protein
MLQDLATSFTVACGSSKMNYSAHAMISGITDEGGRPQRRSSLTTPPILEMSTPLMNSAQKKVKHQECCVAQGGYRLQKCPVVNQTQYKCDIPPIKIMILQRVVKKYPLENTSKKNERRQLFAIVPSHGIHTKKEIEMNNISVLTF